MVKNCVKDVIFLQIFRFFCKKMTEISFKLYIFPKTSLQKYNFPGMRFPNYTFFSMHAYCIGGTNFDTTWNLRQYKLFGLNSIRGYSSYVLHWPHKLWKHLISLCPLLHISLAVQTVKPLDIRAYSYILHRWNKPWNHLISKPTPTFVTASKTFGKPLGIWTYSYTLHWIHNL